MTPRTRGTLLVVLSAASFGCVGLFGKIALREGTSVETTLALRFAVGALALIAVLALTRGLARIRARRAAGFALLGLGFLVTSYFFFNALKTLQAGVASVLLFTSPVLVAVGARLVFGEHLGRRGLAALALALAGVALVAGAPWRGDDARLDPAGAAWALAGAGTYTLYILGSRRLARDVPPILGSTVLLASASVGFVALGAARGVLAWPTPAALLAILGLGIFGSAVAITAFQAGLPAVGAARAAILSTIEPATIMVVGALALGEFPTPLQVGGAVAIVAASVLVATRT